MDKFDLAYFAGLFDGEGSIFIERIKRPQNELGYSFMLHISLCNTNEWVIRQLQFYFGGGVYKNPRLTSTYRQVWVWQLRPRKASEFLELILPYLRIKKPQAELALKFQSERISGKHRTFRESVIDEANQIPMSKMNKGGG